MVIILTNLVVMLGIKGIVPRMALVGIIIIIVISVGVGYFVTRPAPPIKLKIATLEWPPTEAMMTITSVWEEETGVEVEFETMTWEAAHEKIMMEMAVEAPTYDVITFDYIWLGEIIGHLEPIPIEEWEADPEFDWDDFIDVNEPWIAHGAPPGKYLYAPFAGDSNLLYYRTDLFEDSTYKAEFEEEYGRELTVPETWDEFLEVAKFFTMDRDEDGEIDLYGTYIQGMKGDAQFYDTLAYLYSFGVDFLDEDLKPAFNSPEGIEAMEFYADLFYKYEVVPPGSLTYGFDEAMAALQMDKVAMGILWATFWPGLNDPEMSMVAGKLGSALLPQKQGAPTYRGILGGWPMGVPKYSNNKELALDYVKWFCSPEGQKLYAREGGTCFRYSAINDPEVKALASLPEVYAEAIASSIAQMTPILPEFMEIEGIHTKWVTMALTGEMSVEEALDGSAAEIEDLLADYY